MTFDPESAAEVDESSDEHFFDGLMEKYNAQAKKARLSIIDDAFKGLLAAAKEERGKLMADTEAKVNAILEASVAKQTEAIRSELTSKMQAEHNRLCSRVERMIRTAQESAPKPVDNGSPNTAILDEVRACLGAMRELSLPKMDTPSAPIPAPRPSRFSVERDDYGRIKDVIPCYE